MFLTQITQVRLPFPFLVILVCKITFFHKFYYFSDHMYFQLTWFLKRAVAEALKLQKMTFTFRHIIFTGQVFDTGFRGDIYFVFEFHENTYVLTGLKLVAMATVIAWISRIPFDRID